MKCPAAVAASLLMLLLPALQAAPPAPRTAAEATAVRLGQNARQPARPDPLSLAPAKWIWLPAERTLPNTFVLFRKEITLPAAPSKADGWIAADSRYRLTVNGRRVQWGPAPCDPRNLDADPVDLAADLRPGRNVIGVEVLFFGQGDGTWPGGKPGLILNLDVQAGGQRQQIVSDQSWSALLDRAHAPGHYKRWFLRALQEEFDARLYPYGWDAPDFQPDARWVPAQEIPCAPDKGPACRTDRHWAGDSVDRTAPEVSSLRMRQIPPTREEIIAAKGLAHSGRVHWKRDPADWFDVRMKDSFEVDRAPVAEPCGPGAWRLPATPRADEGVEATFELAEQMAGFPRFTIDAPAGTIVELMAQESHDPNKSRWLDSYHFCWARYICREGLNRFEGFDYESLRWMQLHVHNASRPVVVSEVGLRRRQYAWPHEPRIRTSEAPLQRLFDAGINTLRNSALDSVVDGGGRERQQYSGDGSHQLHAVRYAFGEQAIAARFLRTFSEGLTTSGYFLDCYPAYDRLARLPQRELQSAYWGPLLDHGVGFVFDNWNHYLESGDREALRESYPRVCRFADYLWKLRGDDGLLPVENLGVPTVWIDHQAYRNQRNRQCAFNLYAAAMFGHALAPLAEAMGDASPAAESRRRGDELLAAAVRQFWSPELRVFLDNRPWLAEDSKPRMSDRALATSILFDQCPGGDTAAALRALAEVPPEMGLSYPCNAGWRYWALGRLGRADVILHDFRTRWATMRSVAENNTLQEMWTVQADGMSQWSHCPLAPIFVLYQEIIGLRPLTPGFARLQLRPQLGDLPDLEAVAYTPRGPVEFRAKLAAGVHQVEVTLPGDCEAELVLPAAASVSFPAIDGEKSPGLRRYRLPAGGGRFEIPAAAVGPSAKPGARADAPSADPSAAERQRQERHEFQSQELMLAKRGGWIFQPGETPRILWRDAEAVRRLGCQQPLGVRWFDAKLNESPAPDAPGRWMAWIEGTAPNGTPLRRGLTFFALPKDLPDSFRPDLTVAFPNFPGPQAPPALKEHQAELLRLASDTVVPALLDGEKGAILAAGLFEAAPLGHPAKYVDSLAVMNDDRQLALKLKVQGLQDRVRPLRPPRHRDPPAAVLHAGSPAEAGVSPDAKTRIDAVCQAWADDTHEPFVTLVARRGVIVTHEAFGREASGQAIDRDYRCWVASITKTVTGILFSQFLDQGLVDLDDSLATVFPNYPRSDPHVPTFRQCFTHTTGLEGHGEWGGMRNPQLENVVLNGIDVNTPGAKYAYCGLGFELAVKALEIVAGRSAVRLYDEHLFRPLGFGDVPIGSASADGEFTALELGILAQWVVNRGSYGPQEFIRPETFQRLLPEPLRATDRGYTEDEGIGIHWMRHRKAGAPQDSQRPEDLLFGPRTMGHGSFSGCVLLIDPDAQLIVAQVRKQSGPRSGEWSQRFFQAVARMNDER